MLNVTKLSGFCGERFLLCVHAADVENVEPQAAPHLQQAQLLSQETTVTHHQAHIMEQLQTTGDKVSNLSFQKVFRLYCIKYDKVRIISPSTISVSFLTPKDSLLFVVLCHCSPQLQCYSMKFYD